MEMADLNPLGKRTALGGIQSALAVVIFTSAAFFLVHKSWTNATVFLIFFIATASVLRHPGHYFMNRPSIVWTSVLLLVSPFLAEFFAQLGRQKLILTNLDGPARSILVAMIYLYLSRFNCRQLLHALSLGSAAGVFLVFCCINIFPEYYWGTRAATYFVDPITLPCWTVAMLAIYLFLGSPALMRKCDVIAKPILIAMAGYIAVESASRSSWVSLAGVLVVYIVYANRGFYLRLLCSLAAFGCICVCLYLFSHSVQQRTHDALDGFTPFLTAKKVTQEDLHLVQNTSTGQRVVLALIDLELIKRSPLFGVADGDLPSKEELFRATNGLVDDEIYMIKELAGSHSEILAQLVRKGVVFGGLFLIAIFVYPIFIVFWSRDRISSEDKRLGMGLVGLVLATFLSALSIQVFNLKMTVSFYGLCLALFLASLTREKTASHVGPA